MTTIRWKNRIGFRLFFTIALITVVVLLLLASTVLVAVNRFGLFAADVNREQFRNQSVHYLSRLTQEKGLRYQAYFDQIQGIVTMFGAAVSDAYNHQQLHSSEQVPRRPLQYQPHNEMFASGPEFPVFTACWGDKAGKCSSPGMTRELNALYNLDDQMVRVRELLPDALAVHIITVSGIGRYYTQNEKSREAVRLLPKADVFDLRDGAPMTIFTRENRPRNATQWTGIYKDDVIAGLMVTASSPVVDEKGQLLAIAGVDLPLQHLIDDVLAERAEPADVGGGRCLFVVDSAGQLIIFPDDCLSLFGFAYDRAQMVHSSDVLRYNLADSTLEAVRMAGQHILGADHLVEELTLNGRKHLLASQSLPNLGWKFVMVVPEQEWISSVTRTERELHATTAKLKREFILNGILAVVMLLFILFLVFRYFDGPLQELANTVGRVGKGDLQARAPIKSEDELGYLGREINTMLDRLEEADRLKSDYSERLETDINMRTEALREKNVELHQVVQKLNEESQERRRATSALIEGERQLRGIMESSIAGLCIIQDNRFRYVNSALADMFNYSRQEFLESRAVFDLILPHFREMVSSRIIRREAGQYVEPVPPYTIQCEKRDGTVFDLLVAGTGISWEGRPATIGTLIDVSRIKQVEKRLQASLEEKSILLREVYHRTKNNMLVIISMLELHLDGVEDAKARQVFVDIENRIRAMALVHENLYRSRNLAEINPGKYLEELMQTLVESMTLRVKVEVVANYPSLSLPFDAAIPLGLVVNELVTNSLKHAFSAGDQGGTIRLEMTEAEGILELQVSDDGTGLHGFRRHGSRADNHASESDLPFSFGMQLTRSIVEKQLHGTLESLEVAQGTAYRIRFPLETHAESDEEPAAIEETV